MLTVFTLSAAVKYYKQRSDSLFFPHFFLAHNPTKGDDLYVIITISLYGTFFSSVFLFFFFFHIQATS